MKAKYLKSDYAQRGVSLEDIQQTIARATYYLLPYRGRVSQLDQYGLYINIAGLIACIALSTALGMQVHWALSLLFIILYFFMVYIVLKIVKLKQSKYMRQAHFMLAIFCRAENNRFYLRKKLELRPGFLGKWIIFSSHDKEDEDELINMIKKRNEEQDWGCT